MSDPRGEYEARHAHAFDTLNWRLSDAYAECKAACDEAWYDYQVRTGMIDVPHEPDREDASDGDSDAHEGHGHSNPVPAGQPAASENGPENGDGGTENSAEDPADNEAAPQHSG